ncbi:MTH938/NDUFAF3 family protein [Hyphomicrobium sp. CS1GBMeth3]|uniref:Mth938-like domain-containing protein n=1 Tax=Hyphomicrobium sp. CS1GBMeth3 TaxID=1892845 RepID=UPI000930D900|nr:MTH938/NDUFAF3 family protein [Hyphomicrobium sp. CS1GBMeth3]
MRARAHLPQQVPIDAYGNGGFRFGGMSHKGSILCLPTGIWAWSVASVESLDVTSFGEVLALRDQLSLFFLGTGTALLPTPRDVRVAFGDAGVALEAMDTGAAARTYNMLLAEGRQVGAALIAVA